MIILALILGLATPADPALADLQAGIAAFSAGRYSEALRRLQRFEPDAVRLEEQALTWWHLGRALEELGRPCEALPWFEKALTAPGAPAKKVKEKVARLHARTFATIDVACRTPGVAVRLQGVDGELACPGRWDRLAPGRYTIIGRIDGRDFPALQVQTARCKTARAMIEAAGQLKVTSSTPGATVWLDGKALGPAPQHLKAVPTGDYTLEVKAPGHLPSKRTARVPPGGVFENDTALRPVPTADDAPPPPDDRTGAWLSAVAAGGLLAGGTVLVLQGFDAQDTADKRRADYNMETDPPTIARLREDAIDAQDEADLKSGLGYGLLAGGAIMTGVAIWLFARDADDETGLMVLPGGLGWGGRW